MLRDDMPKIKYKCPYCGEDFEITVGQTKYRFIEQCKNESCKKEFAVSYFLKGVAKTGKIDFGG